MAPLPPAQPLDGLRRRVAASATSPFGHVDYPLSDTLRYRGDPGMCGPGSVSWKVIGDVAAFAGGIRALLVQSAHPEVAAGVAQHSRYQDDPLGRLSRTSAYVTATTFGARPEAEAAVQRVRDAHRTVRGISHRGLPYAADDPPLLAWVHNVLTESFLAANQLYGRAPLTAAEEDRFVSEQAVIGRRMGADPAPDRAGRLRRWVARHPDLGPSPGMRQALDFLADPPLPPAQKAGYRLLYMGAAASLPAEIRRVLGVRTRPGGVFLGRRAASFLRWALGSSPSWNLALLRTGSPVPAGLFRQPLPESSTSSEGL